MLLDTNVLLWMEVADPRLGIVARSTVDRAATERQALICPLSFWEAGLAADRGRVVLARPLEAWRRDLLDAGYSEHAFTGLEAIEMNRLTSLHNAPVDRMMVAVARIGGHTLMTADHKLLEWPGVLDRLDSRV